MAAIDRRLGTSYAGLVLNEKGYERAVEAGVDEVRYAFPVTETFALATRTRPWRTRRSSPDASSSERALTGCGSP